MKRRYLSRIAKVSALLLSIALTVYLAQSYLFCYTDENSVRIHDYGNEEPNSLDVVFLGASEAYSAFAPGYAYDKFGFTSYLYTMPNSPASLYKNMLIELRKTQSPQLFVVEIEGFANEKPEKLEDEARLRLFTEGTPFSFNEIDAILRFPCEDKLSHFLPFIKYHGDWQNPKRLYGNLKLKLSGYDEPSLLKGMFTQTIVDADEPAYDISSDISAKPLLPRAEKELIEFLEFLKEEQLDNVLFVRFPHKMSDEGAYERFQHTNYASSIIEQYGYSLRNFEYEVPQSGLSYETDFYDAEHLNIYGTRKFTEYLGQLLVSEYGVVPMAQSEANKTHWEACAAYADAYFALANEYFETNTDIFIFDSPDWMAILDEKVRQMAAESSM